MSISNAFPLHIAEAASAELQLLFGPYCERCCVAGSVRRRAQVCGDLEFVVIPKIDDQAGLFETEAVDRLAAFCEIINRKDHHRLCRPVAPDGKRAPAWGERYKKLLFKHVDRWLPLDLWITDRSRFGSILAIRTGDKDFGRLLVTKRAYGGAMPEGMRQSNGQIERCQTMTGGQEIWTPIQTPDEKDFFAAIGLPVLEPELRSEKNLKALIAGQRVG